MTTTEVPADLADFIAHAETDVLLAAMVVAAEELRTRLSAPWPPAVGGPEEADPLTVLRADARFVHHVAETVRTWLAEQTEAPTDLMLGWAIQEAVGQWLTDGHYPGGTMMSDITADAAHEYAMQGPGAETIGRLALELAQAN